jgi:hypothetical protein
MQWRNSICSAGVDWGTCGLCGGGMQWGYVVGVCSGTHFDVFICGGERYAVGNCSPPHTRIVDMRWVYAVGSGIICSGGIQVY